MNEPVIELEPVARLSRDMAKASGRMSLDEIRFLVDSYYALQEYRKASANQERALNTSAEPHEVLTWLKAQTLTLESQIRRALDTWTQGSPISLWARSIVGIGPVISAGLAAHINIEKCPTAGHIWRFAGLDPTTEWQKGKKRPWNASLKTLCWKIGESFVKNSGHEDDVYGKVYLQRKKAEMGKNADGEFADQAKRSLEKKNFRSDTVAKKFYDAGELPPAHIHARAKRYAVKLFLSHYHHVAYEMRFGTLPPKPYVISHLGHAHYQGPPNWPMVAKRLESTKLLERTSNKESTNFDE